MIQAISRVCCFNKWKSYLLLHFRGWKYSVSEQSIRILRSTDHVVPRLCLHRYSYLSFEGNKGQPIVLEEPGTGYTYTLEACTKYPDEWIAIRRYTDAFSYMQKVRSRRRVASMYFCYFHIQKFIVFPMPYYCSVLPNMKWVNRAATKSWIQWTRSKSWCSSWLSLTGELS